MYSSESRVPERISALYAADAGREILIPRVKFEKAVKKVAGFCAAGVTYHILAEE